jgi:hypothetical protein
MKEREFTEWLEGRYVTPDGTRMQAPARASRVSNCRRIDEQLGDLDGHWHQDQLSGLFDLLTYSRHDAGPKHRIPIAGDAYTGTATLRAAARLYARFCAEQDAVVTAGPKQTFVQPESNRPRHRSSVRETRPLLAVPTREILRNVAVAFKELRGRGVMRTANNPVADYAEYLVARAFDLELLGNSTTGHDAVDAAGVRDEIKARRAKHGATSHQLSAIRKLDGRHFEILVAVIFNEDFEVERAMLIPWDVVQREAAYVPHTNAWNLIVRQSLWNDRAVRDVTAGVRSAAE